MGISDLCTTSHTTTSPTPPSRSSTPERPSSWKLTPPSRRSTPTQSTPSPLDTTNSPPGLSTSANRCSVTVTTPQTKKLRLRTTPPTPTQLTGLPPELLPQLRTRDNADPAGHSPPPVPSREDISSTVETSFLSPHRNSLIATTSAPRDAMVVPCLVPSSGGRTTRPNSSLTTPTPPRPVPVTPLTTPDNSPMLVACKLPPTLNLPSWHPLLPHPPPLPSRLTRWSSSSTPAE